jgi:hypothetical protein
MMYAAIGLACAFLLAPGMREVGLILSALGFSISLVDTLLFLRLIPNRSRSRTSPFKK